MSLKFRVTIIFFVVVLLSFGSCKQAGESRKESKVQMPQKPASDSFNPGISFHEAALTGQKDLVTQFLEKKFDANERDVEGRTPLMYASYNGHVEIMKLLITRGADVNLQDKYGRTALMMAASGPFPQAVKLLLDNNANPDITDKEEHYTALMYAAAEGQLEIVKILTAYRANPFLKDADGDDAITFARNNGHYEVVSFLESLKK